MTTMWWILAVVVSLALVGALTYAMTTLIPKKVSRRSKHARRNV